MTVFKTVGDIKRKCFQGKDLPAYYTSGVGTWFYNNILHLKIM